MITVLEAINLSAQYLERKEIESPRLNAELLLASVIGCKRLELYLSFDRELSEGEINSYRELIKRRGTFEPLQYLTGKVDFFGLEFIIKPDVLIPRPETETLVESILKYSNKKNEISILDIGCGSGIIAITLAASLPLSKIICTDISDSALSIAKLNSEMHNVSGRINFVKHDILKENLNEFPSFDFIVSNPPYISKSDYETLQQEIRFFEPRIALTDEDDGYTFFKEIIRKSVCKLKNGGKLFFEIAQGQSDQIKTILEENKFINIHTIKDLQSIDRVLVGELK